MKHKFKKGEPRAPGAGRKKGTPNKRSASVMEALTEAFEGMGGYESLMKWGAQNPKYFYELWIKMLPSKIEAKTDNTNRNIELDKIPLDVREQLLDISNRILGANPDGSSESISLDPEE